VEKRDEAAWVLQKQCRAAVRIALNLKGLKAEQVSLHLIKGEQNPEGYLAMNPQGLVPSLTLDDGAVLTQSLAIIEWLDETHPNPPLLPADPVLKAKARAFALVIACEIHAVQSLGTQNRLRKIGVAEDAVKQWAIAVNNGPLPSTWTGLRCANG
jgi:maleylpyruvate isomerase